MLAEVDWLSWCSTVNIRTLSIFFPTVPFPQTFLSPLIGGKNVKLVYQILPLGVTLRLTKCPHGRGETEGGSWLQFMWIGTCTSAVSCVHDFGCETPKQHLDELGQDFWLSASLFPLGWFLVFHAFGSVFTFFEAILHSSAITPFIKVLWRHYHQVALVWLMRLLNFTQSAVVTNVVTWVNHLNKLKTSPDYLGKAGNWSYSREDRSDLRKQSCVVNVPLLLFKAHGSNNVRLER